MNSASISRNNNNKRRFLTTRNKNMKKGILPCSSSSSSSSLLWCWVLLLFTLLGETTTCTMAEPLRCGGLLTKPCLGDTDVRYDPDASNDLKDQAIVWSRYEGYYLFEQYFYDEDMHPHYLGQVENNALLVQYFPTIGFANNTVSGSRVYNHRYLIFPGLQEHSPSVATAQDSWETSSYEKDGRSISRGGLLGFSTDATLLFDVAQSVNYVVDDRSLFGSGFSRGGLFTKGDIFMTETFVCLDDNCSQMSVTQDQYETVNGISNRTVASVLNLRKVSEEEWIDAINHAMEEYQVLDQYRVQVPMEGECFTQVCDSILTEEWWCETDPNCSESPYMEPSASVETGVIAGIVVAGFVLMMCFFYGLHYSMLRRQEKRNRVRFARRIADTITVGTSIHALSPEALAEEFKSIDQSETDSSGRISKERLKEFLSSGKAGKISNSDFEALFNAIDLDHSGFVNFIEFCAFLANCEQEFDGLTSTSGGTSGPNNTKQASVIEQSAHRLSYISSPRSNPPTDSSVGDDDEDARSFAGSETVSQNNDYDPEGH